MLHLPRHHSHHPRADEYRYYYIMATRNELCGIWRVSKPIRRFSSLCRKPLLKWSPRDHRNGPVNVRKTQYQRNTKICNYGEPFIVYIVIFVQFRNSIRAQIPGLLDNYSNCYFYSNSIVYNIVWGPYLLLMRKDQKETEGSWVNTQWVFNHLL